jgi:hypothetical protein
MAQPFLFLASACYGGLAQAGFMRSVLAFRAACAARGVALQLELGGGEALIGRGRAAMLAKFLAGPATHLLFADGDKAFDPAEVFRLIEAGEPVSRGNADLLLVTRAAAQAMADAHPELTARLGDLRGAGAASAAMLFESMIDPASGRYLTDLRAFEARWRALSGPADRDPETNSRRNLSDDKLRG